MLRAKQQGLSSTFSGGRLIRDRKTLNMLVEMPKAYSIVLARDHLYGKTRCEGNCWR